MKKTASIGVVLVLAGCSWFASKPAVNPDPNHTHADFAVWIDGVPLDFSGEEFMSETETGEDENHEEHGHKHAYLHLHDGNGHVIHRHKPGLTIGEFFDSLGMQMTDACLTFEEPSGLRSVCIEGNKRWRMVVNGQPMGLDPGYIFKDTDKILLSWGAEAEIMEQLEQMTNDACLYSQTCPERGKPPAENCIADPAVPCVE